MRHLKWYYLIVLGLSILPLISIFTIPQFPHVHDGIVHLARMGAYFKALQDFQIPVRWAGDLNYGYGMPLFNFIYHVPYLLSALFIFLGFGLVFTFKIVLSLSFLLSGVFMFAFAKEFFNPSAHSGLSPSGSKTDGDKKAFIVTVFYQFAPFRFIEMFVRGSLGEVYTYAFFPAVLFGLTLLFRKISILHVVITAFATALLILSHNALSLTFFGICVLFILFFAKSRKNIVLALTSLFLGLMLSSFYWVPAIFEHKYTYGDLFMKDLFRYHFPPIQNFFIPNFTNTEALQTGGISVQFGLFHVLAIILGFFVLLKKKTEIKNKQIVIFSLILIASSLFIMSNFSLFLWEKISFLRQFQFSWRFLGVVIFATSLMSLSFFYINIFKKKWVFITLITLVVCSTLYYWRPPLGFETIDEKYYWKYPLNTTYFGETDVIWSAGGKSSYPKQRVEVIGGKAIIKNFKKKSNLHTFLVDAQSKAQLVDHTQYFPGWRVMVDNKEVKIEFQDPNNRGEITFWVPKGRHFVEIKFKESQIRLFSDVLSIATLIGIFVVIVARKILIK